MRKLATAFALAGLMAASTQAYARGHHHPRHHRHHYTRTEPVNDWYRFPDSAASKPYAPYVRQASLTPFEQPRTFNSDHEQYHPYGGGGITHARLADGQMIAVASAYVNNFVGFFNALYHREGHLPRITCLASGHMRHSLHHWGGACDVGQWARNRAARMMYHVGSLAAEYGLTDGCIWHNPDCGHVDVSGVGGSRHYALRRHYQHHYARRHIRYASR
jgi:hypothetical protein